MQMQQDDYHVIKTVYIYIFTCLYIDYDILITVYIYKRNKKIMILLHSVPAKERTVEKWRLLGEITP